MKLFIIIFLTYISLSANQIYVISSENLKTSKEELKRFFSAKSDYIDGKKFKRISNKESLESLANLAFSISQRKLSKKWIKQNFRKGTPFPTSLKNDKKTVAWVKEHPRTIGFVGKKMDDIYTIYVFGK